MGLYDHFVELRQVSRLGKIFNERLNRNMVNMLSEYVGGGSKILEIGSGMGWFAKSSRNAGYEYFGIEPNKKLSQLLGAEGFNIQCSFVPPIPFKEDAFDLVYCSHVLEHMPDHFKAYDLVCDVYRVLKDGGYFVILYPDIRIFKYEFWNCDYTHHFVLTDRRVVQMCLDSGFKAVRKFKYCGPFIGWKRYIYRIMGLFYPYRLLDKTMARWLGKDSLYKTKIGFITNSGVIVRK
jgi:SAM-dependent methyltransferase